MGRFHDLMDRELRIRGYSESTRKTYLAGVQRLVRHFMRPPNEITCEDIRQYQLHLVKDRKPDSVLIGNNVGKTNGWVDADAIIAKVVDVAD